MTDSGQQKSIDWNAIHKQIAMARQTTEQGWAPTPADKKRILRARAQALAEPIAGPAVAEQSVAVVAFQLAGETYGIELAFVREVYPLKAFTPLPCTPGFVLGIVNVRGQILSVLDLRAFFELPQAGLSELNKVIILRQNDMELGVLADAVLGVQSIPRAEIQPGLPTLTGIREAYLVGVTAQRLVVLDGGRILSDKALVVHEQVET
ncbi:MAG: chemotaxis protein CheW [Rhodocyclaceae bacterium]|nr:chemotaxis protein CheW [Rhodocyclaceae bacterium]